MDKCIITAKIPMSFSGGDRIKTGTDFNINITRPNVFPGTLFGNDVNKQNIARQIFSATGINIPLNSPYLSRTYWDIKPIK